MYYYYQLYHFPTESHIIKRILVDDYAAPRLFLMDVLNWNGMNPTVYQYWCSVHEPTRDPRQNISDDNLLQIGEHSWLVNRRIKRVLDNAYP